MAGKIGTAEKQLAEAIVKDVTSILNYGEGSVSVAMEEIKREEWTKKVYEPEVRAKWDKLYHKPAYRPSD